MSQSVLKRATLGLLVALACAPATAEPVAEKRGVDGRLFYIGAGAGISLLVPKTGETSYRVDDKYDTAYQFNAGIGLGKHWHVDFSHAELGAAHITSPVFPAADVKYDFKGLSGLYYLRGYDPGIPSRGWDLYALAGLARLDVSSPVVVDVRSNNQFFFGAGVEHRFRRGWGARLQATTFDEDASVITLGVIKRFGSALSDDGQALSRPAPDDSQSTAADPGDSAVAAAAVTATPAAAGAPTALSAVADADNDGVPDAQDLCPDSGSGVSVDRSGCAGLAASLDRVLFEPNSAALTADGAAAVAAIAEVLNRYPARKVHVEAHTDSVGSDSYNQALSDRRAAAVMQALINEGVAPERLSAEGKGEREPVASNATAQGRASNRRVAFRFSD